MNSDDNMKLKVGDVLLPDDEPRTTGIWGAVVSTTPEDCMIVFMPSGFRHTSYSCHVSVWTNNGWIHIPGDSDQ